MSLPYKFRAGETETEHCFWQLTWKLAVEQAVSCTSRAMQPHLRFAVGKGQGAMWLGCPPMVVCGRPTFKVNHLHAMHKELCALASARPQTALPHNYEDSTIMLARHRDKLLPVLRINSDRLVQDCLPNCTEDIRTSLLNNRAHIKTNIKFPSSLIPSLFAFADEAFPKSSGQS